MKKRLINWINKSSERASGMIRILPGIY